MKKQFTFSLLLITTIFACKKEEQKTSTTNQKAIEINSDINSPTVWKNVIDDPNLPDYIVKKAQLQVNDQLTIEPGVVVEFESDGMMRLPITTKGFILGKGTVNNPIKFTGVVKTPGSWRGILILNSDDRNEFDYCIFEYGGGTIMQTGVPQSTLAVHTQSAVNGKLKLTNSIVRNSGAYGFILGKSAILNTFSNNTFENNVNAGIQLPPSQVNKLDASSKYNTANGSKIIEILGEDLNELTEQTWKNLGTGVIYKIIGDINILSGLVIDDGTSFQMKNDVMMRVKFPSGYLKAIGTSNFGITFKSEINTKGSWKGWLFNSSDTRNEMSFCTISDGGSASMFSGLSAANIGVITQSGNTGKVNINNCKIESSAGCGMAKDASSVLTESANTFKNNTGNNICQ